MQRRDLAFSTAGAAAAVAALTMPAPVRARSLGSPRVRTGLYTFPGPGTVNTHWIETPDGVVVIDVQRDLTHAREALAAVRAVGKPVLAVLITHGHPDHHAGVGLFKQAWPGAAVLSSRTTYETARADHYGFNAYMRQAAPGDFPHPVALPDRTFADEDELEFDGVRIVAREMGRAEANSGTVFYLPSSGDLFAGDLVFNRMHAFFYEQASLAWLGALDRLDALFPEAATVHPGHGAPGPKAELLERHREYIAAARRIGAAALARLGPTDAAKAEVAAALRARYPDHGRPAGQPDMVELSVAGLFVELAAARERPVR